MGKQTRHPFDGNTHPATEILERVHIDLWGLSHVASTSGKRYMMQIVDAYGGHTEGYFLTDKETDTTLSALKHYTALAERQTGKKIKCLRVVVFESPVRSGLSPPRAMDRDRDRSTKVLIPQKTRPDRSRPLFSGLEPV